MVKLGSALNGARNAGEHLPHSPRRDNPEARMPLVDHIRELRNRFIKIAIAIAAGAGIAGIFFDRIWTFVVQPYCDAVHRCSGQLGHSLIVNGVFDGFYVDLKVALAAGLVFSSPVWIYQVWAFIAPGLYAREKRWTYIYLVISVPLFVAGAYIAHLVMARGLTALMHMIPNGVQQLYSVDTYIGYFLTMILGFGLVFELPLLLVMLNQVGVLTHARFRKSRKILIFLVFVFAGIASPSPDPYTMLFLGTACVALIEVSELIIFLNDKRRGRGEPYAGLSEEEFAELRDSDDPDPAGLAPDDLDAEA